MPGKYGSAYSDTDPLLLAPGAKVNAGIRCYENDFDFAASGVGGTTTPLILAQVKRGCHPKTFLLQTDANLSAINLTIGIAGDTAKYVASVAGPNATRLTTVPKLAALKAAHLEADEVIILTPSGNWPASGSLWTDVHVSKR